MKSAWIVFLVVVSSNVFAAVPRSLSPELPERDRMIKEALRLPLENRIQALRAQPGDPVRRLTQIAFDKKQNLEERWRALTVLPYLDRMRGQIAVEKALESDEWYLRNAGTLALPSLPRDYALEASAKLLLDPALVVRTAAAQNLLKLGGKEKEDLLWQQLNNKLNFKNGQSLWVRRHIAKALAEFAKAGNESRFIAMLEDKDKRLHPEAMRGLERITGQKKRRRGDWLAWWQNKITLRN